MDGTKHFFVVSAKQVDRYAFDIKVEKQLRDVVFSNGALLDYEKEDWARLETAEQAENDELMENIINNRVDGVYPRLSERKATK